MPSYKAYVDFLEFTEVVQFQCPDDPKLWAFLLEVANTYRVPSPFKFANLYIGVDFLNLPRNNKLQWIYSFKTLMDFDYSQPFWNRHTGLKLDYEGDPVDNLSKFGEDILAGPGEGSIMTVRQFLGEEFFLTIETILESYNSTPESTRLLIVQI